MTLLCRLYEELKSVWNGNTPNINKLIDEGKSGYLKAFKILTSICDVQNECPKLILKMKIYFLFCISIDIKDLK